MPKNAADPLAEAQRVAAPVTESILKDHRAIARRRQAIWGATSDADLAISREKTDRVMAHRRQAIRRKLANVEPEHGAAVRDGVQLAALLDDIALDLDSRLS
jgi:hypothetical protein